MRNMKHMGLALAVTAATFAGNASAAIDTASITAAITEGQVAAIAIAVAFGVAVWAVKAVKLVRRG